jgi:hypothetical protein
MYEMDSACSTYGTMRTAYIIFAGKPEGTRPLGRHRSRWEDIKMQFKETG